MPDTKDFLAAWGLKIGTQSIGAFQVTIRARHIEIEQYRKYGFDIEMKFERKDKKSSVSQEDWNKFRGELAFKIAGKKLVYSRYGNPYVCEMGEPKFEVFRDHSSGVIRVQGFATRSFNSFTIFKAEH